MQPTTDAADITETPWNTEDDESLSFLVATDDTIDADVSLATANTTDFRHQDDDAWSVYTALEAGADDTSDADDHLAAAFNPHQQSRHDHFAHQEWNEEDDPLILLIDDDDDDDDDDAVANAPLTASATSTATDITLIATTAIPTTAQRAAPSTTPLAVSVHVTELKSADIEPAASAPIANALATTVAPAPRPTSEIATASSAASTHAAATDPVAASTAAPASTTDNHLAAAFHPQQQSR